MNDAPDVFADAVIDGLVHPIFLAERTVDFPFIADDECFFRDVGANDRDQLPGSGTFDVEAPHRTAASDQRQNSVSVRAWAAGPVRQGLPLLATGESFIDLHDLASPAHRFHAEYAHG